MIQYSRRFDPPAPVIEVVVQSPHNRRNRALLPALVDTGADVSALPSSVLANLRVDAVGQIEIAGLENKYTLEPLYEVQLRVSTHTRLTAEVISSEHDFIILGRDVLNQLILRLDGPSLALEIEGTWPE